MADRETTTFPKMGDDSLDSVVNVSGQRSPYERYRDRREGGPGEDDDNTPGTGTNAHRKSELQPADLTGAAHRIAAVLNRPAQEGSRPYGQRAAFRGPAKRNAGEQ